MTGPRRLEPPMPCETKVVIQRLTALAEALEREPHMLDDLLPPGMNSVVFIDRACEVIAELRRQK